LGIPPGIHRQSFGFEKWSDFDEDLFSDIYNDDSGSREFMHRIVGSDISPKAIAAAEKNIRNAGLKKQIDLSVKPFQQYTESPAPKGVLITNPPYGERIKVDELTELYAMIGERLKHVFTGYNAYVLSYRKESFDSIGLKHSKRFFLFNGALECEMREYEIFSGKRDDRHSRPAGEGGKFKSEGEYKSFNPRKRSSGTESKTRKSSVEGRVGQDGRNPDRRSFGDESRSGKLSNRKDENPRLRRSPDKGRDKQ
jgi:putative N6-adenine-specific DNA methylase